MKILHIFDHSLPMHSGYSFRSLEILKAQRSQGIEVVCLTSSNHMRESEAVDNIEGFKFYRTERISSFIKSIPVLKELVLMSKLFLKMLAVFKIERPDIIHAHSPGLNVLPALLLKLIYRCKVVYEIRAFWEDAAVDLGRTAEQSVRYKVTRALDTFLFKCVDKVIPICDGIRNDILGRGIEKNKLIIVPNAVNPEKFSSKKLAKNRELIRKYKLEGSYVLGFIGSFYAYEGLDLLIKAVSRLIGKKYNIKVLLVGEGPEKQKLEMMTADLELEAFVIFVGRVESSEVEKYYNLIDLLVYPRRKNRLTDNVTPLKPLEAMIQRKTFLASDVGGHKELINHNETGFLFEAENELDLEKKILNILRNQDRNTVISENAYNYVLKHRNWTVNGSLYKQLYRALISV